MTKVCAVVVTYNRAELLQVCLSALIAQTRRLAAIYVIDNASSDATETVVQQCAVASSVTLHYRKLADNIGGAGGFSFGTRLAVADGFERIWMMDDDGIPAPSALEELLKLESGGIVNSLVVDIDDDQRLAFPVENHPGVMTVVDAQNKGSSLANGVSPFNGTLVDSRVFQKVGFPRHGFFIWGDEVDFIERTRRASIGIATATQAIHKHPSNKKPAFRLFGNHTISVVADNRLFTYIRNYTYISLKYRSTRELILFVAKHLIHEVAFKKSASRFFIVCRAILAGLFTFPGLLQKQLGGEFHPAISQSRDFIAVLEGEKAGEAGLSPAQ